MKNTIIIILVLLIIVIGYFLLKPSVPENIEQAQVGNDINSIAEIQIKEKIERFNFVGYGPGKEHEGTFENIKIENNKIIIQANSVKTGIEGLDKHLCADDFFNCEQYPEITFTVLNYELLTENSAKINGELQYRDIIKNVSFEVNKDPEGKIMADFLLDASEFGFKVPTVDSNVRIKFVLR